MFYNNEVHAKRQAHTDGEALAGVAIPKDGSCLAVLLLGPLAEPAEEAHVHHELLGLGVLVCRRVAAQHSGLEVGCCGWRAPSRHEMCLDFVHVLGRHFPDLYQQRQNKTSSKSAPPSHPCDEQRASRTMERSLSSWPAVTSEKMSRLSVEKHALMSSSGTTASLSKSLCMTAEFFSMNGFSTLLSKQSRDDGQWQRASILALATLT